MTTIAVVPARGGSKRIPRKNVRPFLGVPLIVRTLATLLSSSIFDEVVVSTDDDEIARVSEATGASVPFRRSAELADDHAPTRPVVLDALDRYESMTRHPVDEVCVVYPAAVFVTRDDLRSARDQRRSTGVDVVFTATSFPAPVLRAWRERADGLAEMIWPEHENTRSQDLEDAFFDAGQFYWWGPGARQSRAHTRALYRIPRWRVHDIDTEEDWTAAELAFQLLNPGEDELDHG